MNPAAEKTPLPDARGRTRGKTAYLPAIRSMRDYIESNYKNDLLAELARQINAGEIPARCDTTYGLPRCETFCPGTGEIVNISFWRQAELMVLADVVVAASIIQVYTKNAIDIINRRRQEYRVTMWIDMEGEITCEYGQFRNNRGASEHEGHLLNEYLIPYFSVDDIETEVEAILQLHWPEAYKNPLYLNAMNMTHKLGLSVIHLPLYHRKKTQSILFFCDGETIIEDSYGRPKPIWVKGNTIVLNSKYPNLRQEKTAIFHECFHFMEHQMFFKLQRMTCGDLSLMPKWKPDQRHKSDANPVEWMEWQARYGAQCLQMPRSMVRKFADRKLLEMKNSPLHIGQKMERIGRDLASEFGVWKYCARNRLIQVGYGAACGALNYVNTGYVRPLAFSPGECRKGQTFVIGMADAWLEYARNESFCKLLDTGDYIYVDGHFCLHTPEYVQHYPDHVVMTDWANAHVDRCCLRFRIRYTRDRQGCYIYGQLNSDDEYNGRDLTLSLTGEPSKVLSTARELSKILMELPGSFHETLKPHMIRCNVTVERLEECSYVSGRTIKRMRSEERRDYSLDQVIAICLALHLPPELSFDLIEKAGFRLWQTPEHLIYKAILRTMYMEPLDTVQAKLKECGCAPLRLDNYEIYETA